MMIQFDLVKEMNISKRRDGPISAVQFGIRTIRPSELGENPSGWTITGEVTTDYYEWVNEFKATHPVYGWVRGDYEGVVEAKSMKAYAHFVEHHPPQEWDYWDI